MKKNGTDSGQRKKQHVWEKPSPQTVRLQILCILGSVLLSGAAWYNSRQQSLLLQGNRLERSVQGGNERRYQLLVEGLGEDQQEMEISVSPQRYSRQEADELYREIVRSIEDRIVGNNANLLHITEDLELPAEIPELGIRMIWDYVPWLENADETEQQEYFQKYNGLIASDGSVKNLNFSEGEEVSGYLSLILETYIIPDGNTEYEQQRYSSDPFQIYVYVTQKELSAEEKLKQAFEKALEEADRSGYGENSMQLPAEVSGVLLKYSEPEDYSYFLLLLLGGVAAVVLYEKERKDKRDLQKKRDCQLLLDYPEFVSKLIVYIGAGLTLRNAFEKISEQYDRLVEKGREDRYLYQELRNCCRQFERGETEGNVYVDFGKRINLKPYTKLCSLLEQNRKNGSRNLRMLLNLEMADAFEQRKSNARRSGEEAGTKLLLPLFMMLGIVMVIVIVPAMMAFG